MEKKTIIIIVAAFAILVLAAAGAIGAILIRNRNNNSDQTTTETNSIDDATKDLNPDSDYNSEDLSGLTFDQKEDLDNIDKALNDLGTDNQNPDSDFTMPSDLTY